jgi:hypothetical protein
MRVDDQVHRPLPVEHHFARTVARHGREAHLLQQGAERLGLGSRVLDELDSVHPERIDRFRVALVDGHSRAPGVRRGKCAALSAIGGPVKFTLQCR